MARKILLADDSVTAQNMGRKILADAGYEVITVNNGSAALKKIGEAKPDLIVLDVYMPGYSGLEVCQRLKEVGETSRIPVLLTVGKLEPFKPDEAKRVRADGFIVKPFEASELLSALSKLEDKVVPRADSSKPGRFARATAAIEEGRYDKTMAVEEDDSGWKSRISFPKKKKEKPREEEISTGEIYNPVNKDLRTVVEHVEHKVEQAPAAHAEPAHSEEAHVNVGSLAPEGLPKDVTPEEIAALAAAAAQIKGKVPEEKPAVLPAETPVTASASIEAAKLENVDTPKPESVEPAKVESKEEIPPAQAASVPEVAANQTPATLAAQDTPEKAEEKAPEHKSGPAEVMAAIAGLETEWVSLPAAGLGNGPLASRNEKESAEPVTMAVAAAADSHPAESRWTAVAVALAPEEAAISLEQEMQKAYAAFAAAEGAHSFPSEAAPAVLETITAPVALAEVPTPEPVVTQAATEIPASSAPEVVQPLSAVSEAATDAISAAVKELEQTAAKYEAEQSTVSTELASDKAASMGAIESPEPQPEPTPEDKIEEKIETRADEKTEENVESKAEEKIEENIVAQVEDRPVQAPVPEPSTQDVAAALTTVSSVPEVEPLLAAPPVKETKEKQDAAPVVEAQHPMAANEVPEENSSSEQVSTEPVPVSRASHAGGVDDMAKRESETAAAWASWRKIRETGKPAQPEPSAKESEDVPQDRAAMAVAAGAESNPEEATSSLDSDPEIAIIVDSVLADMRPKIVEEIARKLGKKK